MAMQIDAQRWVTSREAAQRSGYTLANIKRLMRQGNVATMTDVFDVQ